ncbi:MAG: hypothetical protein PVJ60_07470, partial [Phycisphaerales bacterium]
MSSKITLDGVSVDGSLFFSEQTSALASIPGMGQLWVKSPGTSAVGFLSMTSAVNTLWFTNNAGT